MVRSVQSVRVAAAVLALSAVALWLSACRPALEQDIDDLQVDLARLEELNQRAQILTALGPLDPLHYHSLDAVVRNDGRIPADAVIWATRARETLFWVAWPAELQAHVDQYVSWLDSLLAAFRIDSATAAEEPSRIVHALAHTFEAALEAWLNREALPAVPSLAGLQPPSHDEGGMSMSQDEDHADRSE